VSELQDLAQTGYEAWAAVYEGDPFLPWDDLADREREAWLAGARAIAEAADPCPQVPPPGAVPTEQLAALLDARVAWHARHPQD
jgi:hypothetical protein